jgi:Na+/proline symporter
VVQGAMLAVGLIVVFVAVLPHAGGWTQLSATLADPVRVHALPAGESAIGLLERWAIPVAGSVVATELVGRILGTRSIRVAERSSYMAAALYVGIGVLPLLIGLLGPQLAPNIADEEQLLPHVARTLLPTAVYAIFAGALISAILSTVDSTLLVASALLSHNLLNPLLRITEDERKVRVARFGVLAFGVIAYMLALHAEGVFSLVEQASAFGSAGTLVTVCFGLFTQWGDARAAVTTLVMGLVAYLTALGAGSPIPFLLSLAAALASYVLVASLTSSRSPSRA